MIINVTTNNKDSRPIRLSSYNGKVYISLVDIIESSKVKDINALYDEDIEKLSAIIGKDNLTSLYPVNTPIPMSYITQEGLKKLIDCPEINECLNKSDLSKIDEFITKNKKMIVDNLFNDNRKLKINKNELSNVKVVVNNTSYDDKIKKIKKINHHIKEIKKHLDVVLKLQEELMEGEWYGRYKNDFYIYWRWKKKTIRYFKSKDNKTWISLDDILVSISFDLDLSNYVSIMNSCNEGEVKLHKRTVIRKNPDYGYLYVEDRHGTDVYISFSTIDILTKINLSYISNKKIKKG